MRWLMIATSMGLALSGQQAAAQDPISDVFGNGRSAICLGQTFSKADLAKRPEQMIQSLQINLRAGAEKLKADSGRVGIDIVAVFRSGEDRDSKALAYCVNKETAIACEVQGEGHFTLMRTGKNAIALEMGQGIIFDTDNGYVDLAASDDKAFVLEKLGPELCPNW
jgi:hypothetical protein